MIRRLFLCFCAWVMFVAVLIALPAAPASADSATFSAVSCSGGTGQVSATVNNTSGLTSTFKLSVGGKVEAQLIGGNKSKTLTVTGLANGSHTGKVLRGTTTVRQQTVSVACSNPVTPDSITIHGETCVSGSGQVSATVKNNSSSTRTYKLSVGGRVGSRLIGGGRTGTIVASGIPDGGHTSKVLLSNSSLKTRYHLISCAPSGGDSGGSPGDGGTTGADDGLVPVEDDQASVNNATCSNGSGSLRANIWNNSNSTRTYTFEILGGSSRQTTISANGFGTITISGLADGGWATYIKHGAKVIAQITKSVSCAPIAVPDSVSISPVTCVSGAGQLTANVKNNSNTTRTYKLSVGGKVGSKLIGGGKTGVITASGVANGSHTAKVLLGTRTLKQRTVAVSCAAPVVPDKVTSWGSSCRNGAGSIWATVKNNSSSTRTYRLSVGGKVGSAVIGAGKSDFVSATGIPNGRQTATVTQGVTTLVRTTRTVSCTPVVADTVWFNAVTCSAGAGRVSATVRNNSTSTRTYKISVAGKVGSKLIGGGKTATVIATGVPNGTHQAKVLLSNRTLKEQSVRVNCILPDTASIGTPRCVSGAGQVSATVKNNSASTRTYKLSIAGKVASKLIGRGQTGYITLSGLPSGNHVGKVLLGTSTLASKTVRIACAPIPVPDTLASVTSTCSGATSRVNAQVRNNSSSVRTYTLRVGGKVASQRIVAGSIGIITATGVPNGRHTAVVTSGTTAVGQRSVAVSCTAPVVPDVVQIGSALCIDEAGRVSASIRNNSSSTRYYKLSVGGKVASRLVGAGSAAGITVTDVPDGRHVGKVLLGNETLKERTLTFSCRPKSEVEWGSGHICLGGGNRAGMKANVTNNGTTTSTYVVQMIHTGNNSVLHASHGYPIGAGKTGEVMLGGIPPGTYFMGVTENGELLSPTKVVTFSDCEAPPIHECNTGAAFGASACPWTTLPVGEQGDIIVTRTWDGPHPTYPSKTATYYEYFHVEREANWTVILTFVGFVPVLGELVDVGFCIYDTHQAVFGEGSYRDAAISCGAALMPLASAAVAKRADDVFRATSNSQLDEFFEITTTGPNRPGTLVPESFDIAISGQNFKVHPNATKHMAEYATSQGGGSIPMASFSGAMEAAIDQGLNPGRNFLTIGPWELGIDTADNVVYHAVYRPS